MKKIIFWTVLTLLAVAIVYRVPRTYKVDKTLEGIEFSMATPDIKSSIKVTIEGTYKTFWKGKDVFQGKVILQNYDVTKEQLHLVVFDSDNGYGSLSYQKGSAIEFLGYIKMDKGADEVIICIFEEKSTGGKIWSVDEGVVITYPKRNLDEIKNQLYP